MGYSRETKDQISSKSDLQFGDESCNNA